jgi:acyl carrier protein
MTPLGAQDVKAFIVSSLRQPLSAGGFDAESVPDDLDLRASGVIDSLGFIQLITDLEARCGCPIDLADLAPEQLTMIGVLCTHIAAQVGTHQIPVERHR